MICLSMPIHASTEVIEFLSILCRKNYHTPFRHPLLASVCWRLGAHAPCPLPAASVDGKYYKQFINVEHIQMETR